jgi:hypothetical protein
VIWAVAVLAVLTLFNLLALSMLNGRRRVYDSWMLVGEMRLRRIEDHLNLPVVRDQESFDRMAKDYPKHLTDGEE